MTQTALSARQIYDTAPLGSLIRFFDGTPEPPARHRRKHAAWSSANGAGRLVRKAPANHLSVPSFTLHVGDFGSGDVTVVRASRVFTLSSPLSYAILDRPRPGQAAVLHDEAGIPTLVHFADTEADAQTWLKAHPRRAARVVAVDVPEPRAFTYLQDPGHGWLIVNRAELDSVGMSSADFSRCSYVLGDSFALEKDRDNAGVLETSRRVRHSLPPSRAPHQRRCPRPSLGLQRRSGSASKLTSGVGRSRKEGREALKASRPRQRPLRCARAGAFQP